MKNFVIDVDGVMTDGTFHYSQTGKVMKVFGPHDADGLKLIRDRIAIQFISADHRGFDISKKRIVDDMGYPLTLVSEVNRYDFVRAIGFDDTAFMGDGFHDAPVLRSCRLGIAPRDARREAIAAADYITPSGGGRGAVMDACLYLLHNFFR